MLLYRLLHCITLNTITLYYFSDCCTVLSCRLLHYITLQLSISVDHYMNFPALCKPTEYLSFILIVYNIRYVITCVFVSLIY